MSNYAKGLKLSPDLFNEVYIPLLHDLNRNLIMYGGRDSAKSYSAGEILLASHIMQPRYARGVLIRKKANTIKDSQYQTLLDIINDWGISDMFYHTTHPLEIVCKLNGNKIIARGTDEPEKLKSLKDPTVVWYEEANQLTIHDYIVISTSLRGPAGSRIQEIFTFNPEKEKQNWLNKKFFPDKQSYEKIDGDFHYVKSTQKDTTILHTNFRDNRYVTQDRIDVLENLKHQDINYYKIYCLGLWGGNLEGLIFPKFEIVDSFPDHLDNSYGLDFGFENPTALVNTAIDENDLYLDEVLYRSKLTTPELLDLLNDLIPDRNSFIYADHDPEKIEQIAQEGFNIEKANKNVSDRLGWMRSKNIKITKRSEHLIDEFGSYIFAKNKDGEPLDKPVKINDHAVDAGGYGAYSHYLNNYHQTGLPLNYEKINRFPVHRSFR